MLDQGWRVVMVDRGWCHAWSYLMKCQPRSSMVKDQAWYFIHDHGWYQAWTKVEEPSTLIKHVKCIADCRKLYRCRQYLASTPRNTLVLLLYFCVIASLFHNLGPRLPAWDTVKTIDDDVPSVSCSSIKSGAICFNFSISSASFSLTCSRGSCQVFNRVYFTRYDVSYLPMLLGSKLDNNYLCAERVGHEKFLQ